MDIIKHWYCKWYHRLSVHSALPLTAPDPACSVRRFLVSAALILPSLTRSLLILSASAMDTTRGPEATPAVAPRPNAHLVESATVALISLCVSWGAPKTLIVLEGMRNSKMAVAVNKAWNQGCSPQDICHCANVEAGQPRVAGRIK